MPQNIYSDPASMALLSQASSQMHRPRSGGGTQASVAKTEQQGMTQRALIEQRGLNQRQAQAGQLALQAQRADGEFQKDIKRMGQTLEEKLHTVEMGYKKAVLEGNTELRNKWLDLKLQLEKMRDNLSRFKIGALLKTTAIHARVADRGSERYAQELRNVREDRRRDKSRREQVDKARAQALSIPDFATGAYADWVRQRMEGKTASSDDIANPYALHVLRRSGLADEKAVATVEAFRAGKEVPYGDLVPALKVVLPLARGIQTLYEKEATTRAEDKYTPRLYGKMAEKHGPWIAKSRLDPFTYFANYGEIAKFDRMTLQEKKFVMAEQGVFEAVGTEMFRYIMDLETRITEYNKRATETPEPGGPALPSERQDAVTDEILERMGAAVDSGEDLVSAADTDMRESLNNPEYEEILGSGHRNTRERLGWSYLNPTAGHSAESQWPGLMPGGEEGESGMGGGVLPAEGGRIPWDR